MAPAKDNTLAGTRLTIRLGNAGACFGLLEALADSTIKLHRRAGADDLAMGPRVAEAVLEFADDLRTARAGSEAWIAAKGLTPRWHQAARGEAA